MNCSSAPLWGAVLIPISLTMKKLAFLFLILFFAGCKNDTAPSLFDPNDQSNPAPVVRSIAPADSALAGASEITLTGENFSAKKEDNIVYFDTAPVEILAASATQLTVKSPNIISDSVKIRIAVLGAEKFSATVRYKLKAAVAPFGKIEDPGYTANRDALRAYGIDVDLEGNIYLSTEQTISGLVNSRIKKIAPNGVTTNLATTTFLRANALRIGPGNTLYALYRTGRLRNIVTFSPAGVQTPFVSLPGNATDDVRDMDFDANGNLWVTIGTDIYLIKPNQAISRALTTADTLSALRVYNGFVYFAGRNKTLPEEKVWRSRIDGETLAAKEVVLDVAAASWLNGRSVISLTFSESGDIYIGTTHPSGMFVVRGNNGEVLYPGLIAPSIYALSWSNGNLVYAVRQINANLSQLLKIDAAQKGAPYHGRR